MIGTLTLTNIFKNVPCDVQKFMYIFDHTVKPVLLYASEIIGMFSTKTDEFNPYEKIFNNLPIEKVNLSMCRYTLGVSRKTCKAALYGELGRYPLYIDIIISMLKYWNRLHSLKVTDKLLSHALTDNYNMIDKG